jgi:hypothetical protein
MILLLVVPAWILILSLVVGLCMAAGAGDRQKQTGLRTSPGWELPESAVISCWGAEDAEEALEPSGSLARSAA